MKKKTLKSRLRDKKRILNDWKINKRQKTRNIFNKYLSDRLLAASETTCNWIDNECKKGLKVSSLSEIQNCPSNWLIIHLPTTMDFSVNYDQTIQFITAIRNLVNLYEKIKNKHIPENIYVLKRINFDGLLSISTSAALVLTAEISKWDTTIRKKLKPLVDNWDDNILTQFTQLGFFDLFENKHKREIKNKNFKSDVNFVRYVKGKCGNTISTTKHKKQLKKAMSNLVGTKVPKWTILHSGLSEAVTNVSHHAYSNNTRCKDKSWYLTGSFNNESREMKIAFYDQGIGIPNSLPESDIWEKVVSYFSTLNIPYAERKKHSKLLEAAVNIDRTRTDEDDRGKGLQDLIEFIRQRGEGYLTIISYLGLYKVTVDNGKETTKKSSFKRPLNGTLIIWSINLNE